MSARDWLSPDTRIDDKPGSPMDLVGGGKDMKGAGA